VIIVIIVLIDGDDRDGRHDYDNCYHCDDGDEKDHCKMLTSG
jgi:hypothetical protein